MMRQYHPNYIEFPKWVYGVLTNDAAEELEIRAAAEAEVEAAKQLARAAAVEVVDAVPPEPKPARPPASTIPRMCPTPSQGAASARPPASAMTRMQLMRQRRRAGKRTIQLEISAGQIEGLIAAGMLDPAMRDDATGIAHAVGRLMDRHVTPAAPRS